MKNFRKLIGFEFRKSFSSPWLLIFLACLLLMNGWKLGAEYADKTTQISTYPQVYGEFYSRWSGDITTQKITELMTIFGPLQPKYEQGSASHVYDPNAYTYSEYSDAHFFATQFYTEMQYDYLYQNEAIRISGNAGTLQKLYADAGNGYEAKKNAAVAEIFKGRAIRQFADTHWVEVWLNHDYSAMLVLLLCLFGLCTVFVTERETEMYMLLRTAKNGGGKTVAAKLTASALFAVAVSVLFFAEDILVPLALSGRPEALSSPVYAIRYLETTPLNMTVGQFLVWTVAVKTLGVLGCGCVILLISCLCRRVLTTFVAGFGALMALTVLQEFCRTRFGLKWFDPMELVIVREIVTETKFVNVLGQPVLLHSFVIGGVLLTMGALYGLILRCNPGAAGRRRGGC